MILSANKRTLILLTRSITTMNTSTMSNMLALLLLVTTTTIEVSCESLDDRKEGVLVQILPRFHVVSSNAKIFTIEAKSTLRVQSYASESSKDKGERIISLLNDEIESEIMKTLHNQTSQEILDSFPIEFCDMQNKLYQQIVNKIIDSINSYNTKNGINAVVVIMQVRRIGTQ
jgi:hypothetical protein